MGMRIIMCEFTARNSYHDGTSILEDEKDTTVDVALEARHEGR